MKDNEIKYCMDCKYCFVIFSDIEYVCTFSDLKYVTLSKRSEACVNFKEKKDK